MMGRLPIELVSCRGLGDHIPPLTLSQCWRQSRLPDPQKKKKKKSGKKQRLDPTTTAKLVPTGKFPLGTLMVVVNTRPGGADDLWLCPQAAELVTATPTGFFLLSDTFPPPPPPSRLWDGTTSLLGTSKAFGSLSL